MKKIYTSLVMLFASIALFATHVNQYEAQKIAVEFYAHYALGGFEQVQVSDVSVIKYKDISTYYIFIFKSGGFILVSADDAAIPILAYSFENEMPHEILNPAVKKWLDGYNLAIYNIIEDHWSNTETLKKWNAIRDGHFPPMMRDINPLLTTLWDQGCFYNALCPIDGGGPCNHVYTGCVATAMAQIMKYHNFPPQGVGSHSYSDPPYGTQTADFEATTYNWAAMPISVTGSNTAVATLMYHAGVSVNMQYSASGSGAYSEAVPYALLNYFNYHPDVVIKYKSDYPNLSDWQNLLRADLDQQLPIYYSGDGSAGHAFVCDGYHMSDGTFHFNWGWSGSCNGWYVIGGLNPGGENFNNDNAAVVHIKPYNPNLIVRIIHPVDNAVIGEGYSVEIVAVTVRGTPTTMKLYIDSVEKFSIQNDTMIFIWNTSSADLGSHEVKAFAYSATDTVFYKINLNVAEWISQASGFTTPSRGISYMSAIDSNIVWASAFDATNPTGACSDFTKTTNGGNTWTPGVITNTQGLASAMIFGMDSNKAYVPMYRVSGSKPQGIYMTSDGGATWTRQTTASFSNVNSFPDCIHFFSENEGWCLGDPINGEFEIYTTIDGGTNWTQVSGSNIPNPLSGEFGIVGYYSVVNDSIWFGTNKGRIYRSPDKGYTWTVSTVPPLNGKYIKPTFRSGSHGLVQDKDLGTTGTICETFDGGDTWSLVTNIGTIYATDLAYVPGTTNTWVSTGSNGTNGASYSFDGGHSWTDFLGTQGAQYMQMTWINNHCGWAGGINTNSVENGIYKYIGVLMPALPTPVNLLPEVTNHNVHLTWNPPVYDSTLMTLLGYNMYRDGMKLNINTITNLFYDDFNVPTGEYTYCVKALYNLGESTGDCEIADIAVMVPETNSKSSLLIYPNPVNDLLTVHAPSIIIEIRIFDHSGKQVYRSAENNSVLSVNVSGFPSGLYLMSVITKDGILTSRVVVQ